MPAPSATLPLTPPVVVEFNMSRLEAIEDATGKTCNELLMGEFRSWISAGDQDATPEAREAALRRVSAKVARRFLAGVLGCRPEQLDDRVAIDQVMACVSSAVGAFIEAVVMLNGGKKAAEPAQYEGPFVEEEPAQKGPTEPAASPA